MESKEEYKDVSSLKPDSDGPWDAAKFGVAAIVIAGILYLGFGFLMIMMGH